GFGTVTRRGAASPRNRAASGARPSSTGRSTSTLGPVDSTSSSTPAAGIAPGFATPAPQPADVCRTMLGRSAGKIVSPSSSPSSPAGRPGTAEISPGTLLPSASTSSGVLSVGGAHGERRDGAAGGSAPSSSGIRVVSSTSPATRPAAAASAGDRS